MHACLIADDTNICVNNISKTTENFSRIVLPFS